MITPGQVRLKQVIYYVGRPLAILFAWDVMVTAVYLGADHKIEFPALPIPLFGTVIAIYLSFRNTAAYARWWEARTLWGVLVNTSRSFAREIMMLLPSKATPLARELIIRHIAYLHSLRLHLRREVPWDELAAWLSKAELLRLRRVTNVPNAILYRTAEIIAGQSEIDSIKLVAIEQTMVEFSNAQGGMERIKNTPLPRQYAIYPVFFTHVFCALLPLGLVESLGWYTPLGSTAAGSLFLALLKIGDDLQDPFSNTINDVPMSTLTRSIEIELLDGINEAHSLKPFRAENDVLW